jgi:hypothetical protein
LLVLDSLTIFNISRPQYKSFLHSFSFESFSVWFANNSCFLSKGNGLSYVHYGNDELLESSLNCVDFIAFLLNSIIAEWKLLNKSKDLRKSFSNFQLKFYWCLLGSLTFDSSFPVLTGGMHKFSFTYTLMQNWKEEEIWKVI